MNLSIHIRLLLAASLVLTAFLGLTGVALDKAFRSSAEKALRESLQASVYALLAAAGEDDQGRLTMPEIVSDPRFNLPDSGFYAEVHSPDISFDWRSASAVGRHLNIGEPSVEPGERRFSRVRSANGGEVVALSFGVSWEDFDGVETQYVLSVVEDIQPHQVQITTFRNTLFYWLGGAALVLLLAQGGVLRWGLFPLRKVSDELSDIESGGSDQLKGVYPQELTGLTDNINSLIRQAQSRQQRYRDSLGDLAHSLKTPLAILQGMAELPETGDRNESRQLAEQVYRMNQIVSHQLQRAAASGRSTLALSTPVGVAVERIAITLSKVYLEKGIRWELDLPDDLGFPGDEGDLMEFMGNLMDNAWKYGSQRVRISGLATGDGIELHVEDDGAGIPQAQAESVLQRGRRMDEQQPGQGIGLAVVSDIISAYGGELIVGKSVLGGADLVALIPNH